jgi:hypothetical protein
MKAISMATRAELIEVTRSRYTSAPKVQKQRILDEFAAVTGYHRKHAMPSQQDLAVVGEL